MSVDTVTLLLPIKNQQNLAVYATLGLEEEIVQQIRIPIGQGFAGRIAATIEPMIVNNLSEIEIVSPILRHKGLRSLVGIPLPVNQSMIGVLHVGTFQSHQFSDRDVQQLQLIGHVIEGMIADAGLFNFEWDTRSRECSWDIFRSRIGNFYVNVITHIPHPKVEQIYERSQIVTLN